MTAGRFVLYDVASFGVKVVDCADEVIGFMVLNVDVFLTFGRDRHCAHVTVEVSGNVFHALGSIFDNRGQVSAAARRAGAA